MTITENASLLPYNTFGINARARILAQYNSAEDLTQLIKSGLLVSNRHLHVGQGSNLLFLNDFDGVILHSGIMFIKTVAETAETIRIEVGAGIIWDDFVDYAVKEQFYGIENLSLIPGETGAAAIQNIGAYGSEVCDTITEVRATNLESGEPRIFSKTDCNYNYRESIFKTRLKGLYAVTSVVFELSKKPVFNLSYQHLEQEVLKNGEITLDNIRQTIIAVRESKLPDPKVSGNAGSFFMNPVVPRNHYLQLSQTYPDMPHYFVSDSEEKIPAAWLIDQCGWKGKTVGNAGVHDRQALVLVNKGNASGSEIAHLAGLIQESVKQKFGIVLTPEVNYIS